MPERSSAKPGKATTKTRREHRLASQATYQKAYREKQRAARAPSRGDVANLTLYWFITLCLSQGDGDGLAKMQTVLVEGLAKQGFDRAASARRIDEIITRYEDGWTFRPKARLAVTPDGIDPDALLD